MPRDVHFRFRHEVMMPGGQVHVKGEEGQGEAEAIRKAYGDDIEILSYADGSDYDLNLREQAAERRENAEDVVVDEKPIAPKAKQP